MTSVPLKGYKAFRFPGDALGGLCSSIDQYVRYFPNRVYEVYGEIKVCNFGYHFCEYPIDCFKYLFCSPDVAIYEIEVLGETKVDENEPGKFCTNKMRILGPINGHYHRKSIYAEEFCTFVNGQLNSINDQPAHVTLKKALWYRNNLIHRGYRKPAVMYPDGSQEWYVNGEQHRDDGLPAYISIGFYGDKGAATDIDWWKSKQNFWKDLTIVKGVVHSPYETPKMCFVWSQHNRHYREKGLPCIILIRYSCCIPNWSCEKLYPNKKSISVDLDKCGDYIVFKKAKIE